MLDFLWKAAERVVALRGFLSAVYTLQQVVVVSHCLTRLAGLGNCFKLLEGHKYTQLQAA
jgi:hypothetical protein